MPALLSHFTLLTLLLLPIPTAGLQEPAEGSPAPSWIGREAPALETRSWINLAPGEARPRLEDLRGSVVLLEFWATVQKACGKGLPHAQQYRDRFGPHGLEVLALSYDPGGALQQQVDAYGITVRLGTDTSMADFHGYQVPSVPFTCVVGADGRVLYRGTPEQAEPVLLRALGLEAEPARLLEGLARATSADERRAQLEWLIERAPRAFDLVDFASERAEGGASDASPETPEPAATLDAWLDALEGGADGDAQLALLAASEARAFDLRRWAWARLAREAPLGRAEFDELLAAREFTAALDALLFRAPSDELLGLAAESRALKEHCSSATREARALAKKALLAERWYLSGIEPRSRNAYWGELGLGGDPDGTEAGAQPTLVIGFERLDRDAAASYFEEAMLRHLASLELASGRAPDVAALCARIPKERQRLLRSAEAKHGRPADH